MLLKQEYSAMLIRTQEAQAGDVFAKVEVAGKGKVRVRGKGDYKDESREFEFEILGKKDDSKTDENKDDSKKDKKKTKKVKIGPDFIKTVKLETIESRSGGDIEVETNALRAFCKLRDDLQRNDNITIGIDSAYRSIERQKELMKEFTDEYGADYAKKTVAEPGTSSGHRDNRHPLDPDPLDDTLHADVGDLKAGDVDEGEAP